MACCARKAMRSIKVGGGEARTITGRVSGLCFEGPQVGVEFFLCGDAGHVPGQHLASRLVGLLASPQRDEEASNDGRIELQLNAVGVIAHEVAAAEDVLKKAKEDLNLPAPSVDEGHHVGRQVHAVGGHEQRLAGTWTAAVVLGLSAALLLVRAALDLNDAAEFARGRRL